MTIQTGGLYSRVSTLYYMNMASYNCCRENSSELKRIVTLSSLLKIVAEENRLKLLCILKHDTRCVCEMMEQVEMSQSLISHHLADLKEADLVNFDKKGRRIYYKLTERGLKIMSLLETL